MRVSPRNLSTFCPHSRTVWTTVKNRSTKRPPSALLQRMIFGASGRIIVARVRRDCWWVREAKIRHTPSIAREWTGWSRSRVREESVFVRGAWPGCLSHFLPVGVLRGAAGGGSMGCLGGGGFNRTWRSRSFVSYTRIRTSNSQQRKHSETDSPGKLSIARFCQGPSKSARANQNG